MAEKSRGELLRNALVSAGIISPRGNGGAWPALAQARYDHAAVEYDKACAAYLPPDVLAFVEEVERQVEKGDGGADKKDTLSLCQIVREQAAELRLAAGKVVRLEDRNLGIIREKEAMRLRLQDVVAKQEAMRDRLAKLEPAAVKLHAAPFDSDAWRELGALLPEMKDSLT